MRRSMVVLALALLPGAAAAQSPSAAPTEQDALTTAREARRAGRYLDAAAALRPYALDAAGKPNRSFAGQQAVEYDTLLRGDPDPTLSPPDTLDAADAARFRSAEHRDAIAAIVARARATRVVILNEHHGLPRTRAFALEVARALRPLGYSVLAVETFSNVADDAASAAAMATIARDGHVRRTSGHYTAEPVFADFVRQSLALGYRPIAYEVTDTREMADPGARLARREQAQADYLARRALADPAGKLLVFVGFSHVAETPIDDFGDTPTSWMATRLKAATGIDPLTIDQATLAHTAITRPAGVIRSTVAFAGGKPLVLGQYDGAVDLQVVHPPTRKVHGRPDWLAAMGGTPTPIPPTLLPARGTRLVQAFIASEPDDAIPVDQVLVTAGATPPMLMLPQAPVRFAVQDGG